MAQQLDMFSPPNSTPKARARTKARVDRLLGKSTKPTIEERFAEFHAKNPHVFEKLRELALKRVASGITRIGVKALWEEARASLIRIEDGGDGADTDKASPYKLNNDFTALYARMLVQYPALEKVIELRRRKGDK